MGEGPDYVDAGGVVPSGPGSRGLRNWLADSGRAESLPPSRQLFLPGWP